MASNSSMLECSICLYPFTKPKILPCVHTFCEKCLIVHVETTELNGKFRCPVCREKICVPQGGVGEFKNNIWIDSSKRYICSKHKKKELLFYCRNCDEIICVSCITVKHMNHKIVDIEDIHVETQDKLNKIREYLESQKKKTASFIESTNLRLNSVKKTGEQAIKDIDNLLEEIYQKAKIQADKSKDIISKNMATNKETLFQFKVSVITKNKNLENELDKFEEDLKNKAPVPVLENFQSIQQLLDQYQNCLIEKTYKEYYPYAAKHYSSFNLLDWATFTDRSKQFLDSENNFLIFLPLWLENQKKRTAILLELLDVKHNSVEKTEEQAIKDIDNILEEIYQKTKIQADKSKDIISKNMATNKEKLFQLKESVINENKNLGNKLGKVEEDLKNKAPVPVLEIS